MVLFAMTASIVDCLNQLGDDVSEVQRDEEPSLASRAVGKPISHSQVLRLWKHLQASKEPVALESLLFGAQIYTPPPPPKPEQSDEYKALMARLRREEDERAYERMINPPPRHEIFNDRFPSAAASYVAVNKPMTYADTGDDEVTLNEVNRQVMLILNFLASILGVAGTIWVVARWWSLPARIFLTLFGSIVVAIAEVGVYWAYVWKMDQGNTKEKTLKETKEVIQTWVVGKDDEKENDESVLVKEKTPDTTLRKRDVKGEGAS